MFVVSTTQSDFYWQLVFILLFKTFHVFEEKVLNLHKNLIWEVNFCTSEYIFINSGWRFYIFVKKLFQDLHFCISWKLSQIRKWNQSVICIGKTQMHAVFLSLFFFLVSLCDEAFLLKVAIVDVCMLFKIILYHVISEDLKLLYFKDICQRYTLLWMRYVLFIIIIYECIFLLISNSSMWLFLC